MKLATIASIATVLVWTFCFYCGYCTQVAAAASDLVGPGPIPLTKNAQYAGLVQVNASTNAQMFYWWITSNVAPQARTTPVVVWLEGGPGFSSVFQAMYGMGPYHLSHSGVAFNEHTWLNDAHLVRCATGPSRRRLALTRGVGFDDSCSSITHVASDTRRSMVAARSRTRPRWPSSCTSC